MNGSDKDLAAHFTVIQKRGLCLCGEPIEKVFAPVPAKDYLDSIYEDISGAGEEIFQNPTYIILNLARVLAFKNEGLVLSKKEGAEWGLKNLPQEFHGLIKAALKDYEETHSSACSLESMEIAGKYAAYMLNAISE